MMSEHSPGARVLVIEGTLADLLGAILSGRDVRREIADFGSAHFFYDLPTHLDMDRYNRLAEYGNALPGSFLSRPSAPFRDLPMLEDVLRGMVRSETSLQFRDKQFHGFMGVSARRAMASVLDRIARDDRKLAFPLPNWHFWDLKYDGLKQPEMVYFDARHESELVEGFEKAVTREGAQALMLVNPANPLLFDLSESGARAINGIASKYGVDVIIDDVLRGTRPRGSRDSVGRFFDNPYVVESLSKRFGDEPCGQFSYVIVPPRRKVRFPDSAPTNTLEAAGGILEMALGTCSEPAIDELTVRNRLFDKGFNSASCGVGVYRPFPSSLTSVLLLPQDYPVNAKTFAMDAYARGGIGIIPFDAFYPEGYSVPADMQRLLRITVGRIDREEMEDKAAYLGSGFIQERKERTRD